MMTTSIVYKKTLTKSGGILTAQMDGVVKLNISGTLSYMIDTSASDGSVCYFQNPGAGENTTMTTLYAQAKTAYPALFV